MTDQEQFLSVANRDEAEVRFRAALDLQPLGAELIALSDALGRILADDVCARVDVPSFDRANVDGFAVRAVETFGATELAPKTLRPSAEIIEAGTPPCFAVQLGEAVAIATGGMLPRGADAVAMIEHTERRGDALLIRRAVNPGSGIAFAGTDIASGETVLRAGTRLTSRETGVLAALGEERVTAWRRPRVAIISTGNEIIAPGQPMHAAKVYDSNARILADAVRELGGEPRCCGIVRDDMQALRSVLRQALVDADMVLLSGGTSKGKGDLCYRVVAELNDPGIIVHGVALKPGKPLCLAASAGKPVVILPGFPTSAIFTFHEFVAPIIQLLAGQTPEPQETVAATLAVKTNSEIGRTEYLLVGLVKSEHGLIAFPLGKGSGSVTSFSRADGFVTIGRHTEIVEAGQSVDVRLIGRGLAIADLVVIGSHCIGLDYLLAQLQRRGFSSKVLNVGSSAGLAAVQRGQCDLAGIHLLDPHTGRYNHPFLDASVDLIAGYRRVQGIVFRSGDTRFAGTDPCEIIARVAHDPSCVMINRNQGSGTRILIDRLLGDQRPSGYAVQPSNHTAVAVAVRQHRADWGVTIESVARGAGLSFLRYQDEAYDFVAPKARLDRPALVAFRALLAEPSIRQQLESRGLRG